MTKFSYDFKLKVVKEYLQGTGSPTLSKKYGIENHFSVLNWVKRYQKFGPKGLEVRSPGFNYDGNFKLDVLAWKKQNQVSYSKTALHFDISNPGTIANWQRKVDTYGPEILFNKRGQDASVLLKLKQLERQNQNLIKENQDLKNSSSPK